MYLNEALSLLKMMKTLQQELFGKGKEEAVVSQLEGGSKRVSEQGTDFLHKIDKKFNLLEKVYSVKPTAARKVQEEGFHFTRTFLLFSNITSL